jgi:hypothetical protein
VLTAYRHAHFMIGEPRPGDALFNQTLMDRTRGRVVQWLNRNPASRRGNAASSGE